MAVRKTVCMNAVVIFASAPAHADDGRDDRIIAELDRLGILPIYETLIEAGQPPHDVDLLARRFIALAEQCGPARIGYTASGIGAAGALVAAAMRPDLVEAVVAIDARTDLAVDALKSLRTPTLLVVKDMPVLRMNREALTQIRGERRIEIVHGDIDAVVQKSVHWLEEKLLLNTRSQTAEASGAEPPSARAR